MVEIIDAFAQAAKEVVSDPFSVLGDVFVGGCVGLAVGFVVDKIKAKYGKPERRPFENITHYTVNGKTPRYPH